MYIGNLLITSHFREKTNKYQRSSLVKFWLRGKIPWDITAPTVFFSEMWSDRNKWDFYVNRFLLQRNCTWLHFYISRSDATFVTMFPVYQNSDWDIQDLIFTSLGIYAIPCIRHYINCENTVLYRNRSSNIQNIYRNSYTLSYWYNFPYPHRFISNE